MMRFLMMVALGLAGCGIGLGGGAGGGLEIGDECPIQPEDIEECEPGCLGAFQAELYGRTVWVNRFDHCTEEEWASGVCGVSYYFPMNPENLFPEVECHFLGNEIAYVTRTAFPEFDE